MLYFIKNKTKYDKTEDAASVIGIIGGVNEDDKSSKVKKEDLVNFYEITKSPDVVFYKNVNKKNFT